MKDDILYHYTSLEVLKCIFEGYSPENPFLTFWATNCAYMNDPQEISEGIDLIKDALTNISCPVLKERSTVIIENEYIKEALLIGSAITSKGVAYAISFSKNKDNLNMWRMYGNNGKGIALGFKYERIKSENCSLDDCYYNKEKGRELLIETIRKGFELIFSKLEEGTTKISQREYDFVRSLEAIGLIAARIKNEVYSYEKEKRLITYCKHPLFRACNDILIPYTTIKLPLDALVSIVIGPDCDERNINSLRLFFLSKGLNRIAENIETSQVPYRN